MYKKILFIILSIIIAVSVFITGTAANDNTNESNDVIMPVDVSDKSATVIVSDVAGKIGEEISVDVVMENNPGIAAFRFYIDFDEEYLEPVSVSKGAAVSAGNIYSNVSLEDISVVVTTWDNASDVAMNGVVFTMVFKIKDTSGLTDYPLKLTYNQVDVCNENFEDVYFEVVDGSITVNGFNVFADGATEIEAGQTLQMLVSLSENNALRKEIIWSSDNENVAVVDENGTVTGIGEGKATITANVAGTSCNAACEISVFEPVVLSRISVNTMPEKMSYYIGDTFVSDGLTLTAEYSDGSTSTVESGFTCSPLTFDKEGEQTVTVTYEEMTAEFTVTVERLYYTVNWIVDGVTTSVEYKSGEAIAIPTPPEKEGFTFEGWTPEIPETMPKQDLTFIATWTANIYDVIFEADGGIFPDGETQKTFQVEYGSEISVPDIPEKYGHNFTGWKDEEGNFYNPTTLPALSDAKSITFTAVWIELLESEYEVHTNVMNPDGSSYTLTREVFTAYEGETVNAEYEIGEGFCLNEEQSVLSGVVTSEKTLILNVVIDRIKYTLTTVVDGKRNSTSYYYGQDIVYPDTPIKDDYSFNGWYDYESKGSVPDKMPARNVYVYAQWRSYDKYNESKIDTYESLVETYGTETDENGIKDGFIYVGTEYYEENGELTDYFVEPGDTLTARVYVKSNMYIGQMKIISLYDNDFFDVRLAGGEDATVNSNGYSQNYKGTINSDHPIVVSNNCTHLISSDNIANVPQLMRFCGFESTYLSETDMVMSSDKTTLGSTDNFAYNMQSDEWIFEYYVKIREDVEEGQRGVIDSPDIIWQSSINPSTGKYDPRKLSGIRNLHADQTDESSVLYNKCRTMSLQMDDGYLDYFIKDDLCHEFTIMPRYIPSIYEVSFWVDGEEYYSFELEYGEKIPVPDVPQKDGYTFIGWTPEIPETMPERDCKFVAVFKENQTVFTGKCGDNLTWTLNTETGKLTISGEGDMYDYEYGETPWFDYSASIKDVIIEDGVTSVGAFSFCGCNSIMNVKIGDDVTIIKDSAFASCSNIENLTLGNSITTIGYCAFYNCCYKLTNITVPDSVINIGEAAFYSCNNLTNVTIGNGVKSIGKDAFYGCDNLIIIEIPDNVNIIDQCAFECCYSLSSISIGENVTDIKDGAFYRCDNLTDVYYNGTEEEWKAITIGSDNENLTSANIHFKYFTVTFNADGGYFSDGSNELITKVELGEIIEVETPVRENYTFTGWADADGNAVKIPDIMPDENLTFIATWIADEPEHVHIPQTITIDATCTVDGMEYTICMECGETIGEATVIPALNHSKTQTVTIDATCTIAGMQYEICEFCGETIGDAVVLPAPGHKPGDWETSKNPTCTEKGEQIKKCTVCGVTVETGELPALGHTTGEWETSKNPSCTEKGEQIKKCTVCSVIVETQPIKENGHTPAKEWTIILKPTTEKEGKRVIKCLVCGAAVEEDAISKLEVAHHEDTDVSIEYQPDDYRGNVSINVEETFDGGAFNLINTQTGSPTSQIFDIKMTVDGKETQPEGKVTVRIPLPEGYNPNRSFVYHVDTKTGKVVKMNSRYENGYLVFETDHFSYYAVVDESQAGTLLFEAEIRNPSTTTIKYGDSIILHVDIEGELPKGAKIEWSSDNNNFTIVKVSADGKTCTVTPNANGDTVFTAKVVDANGNELSSDTQSMTSKAGFFQKIIAFFKKLFGLTKVIPEAFKDIL